MSVEDQAREYRLRCTSHADRYDVNYLLNQLQQAREALAAEHAARVAAEEERDEALADRSAYQSRWHATMAQRDALQERIDRALYWLGGAGGSPSRVSNAHRALTGADQPKPEEGR